MKHYHQVSQLLLLLLIFSAAIVGCKHDPENPPVTPALTIAKIDPATAPVGSTIAVSGSGFSTDPASTTVTIGGVQATIVSITPTQIIVTVPSGVTSGPVVVTSGGQTAQSPNSFTVSVAPLKPVVIKEGTLDSQTWTKDNIYLLNGLVYIREKQTLTIQPGTVIKGSGLGSALVIERLAQINAQGTAAQPIVFTSNKAVGQRAYGDWGGLVLIGKSPVKRAGTVAYPNGIRGNVETYSEPFDNSGTLQYVRIEYAGAAQSTTPATRFSGLTLIGVGSGTVIDHVQVSYSGNNAFSWFGGTAQVKNLFAYRSFNDDWTADWGYVGNVQFGVALRDAEVADLSGSNGFEVENYESSETADAPAVVLFSGLQQTVPVFANMSSFAFSGTPTTVKSARGTGAYQSGAYLRRNSAIAIYNSLFYGYPEGIRLESMGSTSGLTSNSIDLRGIVMANVLTPAVGAGVVTTDQATTYINQSDRANSIIASSNLASLLLNTANFTLTAPSFVPQSGSPLLTGAVTGGKLTLTQLASAFFTPVTYRGAFGTDNWLTGWTNVNPQTTDYDR